MGKEMSRAKFIIPEPQPSLSIVGILREALKVTIRNGKVMMSILLPVFISLSLLAVGAHLASVPILTDLLSKMALVTQEEEPVRGEVAETLGLGIVKDVRRLLVLQLVVLVFSCVVLLNFSVATISSSFEAYTGKILNLKDMLLTIRKSWKRAIVTTFFMTIIFLSIMALILILLGFVWVMSKGVYLILLTVAVVILGTCCYVYIASVWMLSMVVSIVEDDSSGLRAIDRAGELMKGKRIQGCVIMLPLTLIIGAIYRTPLGMIEKIDKITFTPMIIRIAGIWLICVVKLFMFVVYSVFYHECKKAKDELGWYAPVAPEEA
ncbi:uncharacterized protein LOC132278461 [Cornus florida]|uniref:uncharacterized protein LOC132278461 n=1 Tax=Cornus florida TaxID=4283 RepID=UPI00289B5407|nr:uncharacterized protein LOC132278461 [Cornus florida]